MNLIVESDGHVGVIKLNRPETKNALDPQTLIELYDAWNEFKANDQIRVVILASALEDSFCSGMDLNSTIPIFTGVRPPETEAEKRLAQNPTIMFEAMLRQDACFPKPIVCAINGYCLTGGWEMAMATDIRVAAQDAVFQMREARYALMPSAGSTVRLPRLISPARALWVLMSGEVFTAEQMLDWGFLNRIVPPDQLMDAAKEMAGIIAANGPLSVKGIKASVNAALGLPLDEALNKEMEIATPIMMSADAKEGPRAFKEKRPPKFQGK